MSGSPQTTNHHNSDETESLSDMTFTLGIDIGTSKVASVIVDNSTNELCDVSTVKTRGTVFGEGETAEQDPWEIFECIDRSISSLSPELRAKVGAIGVTGQMHGIVFWDSQNDNTSRLVTWQDGRCSEGNFLTELHKKLENDSLKDGFGISTLAWYQENKPNFLSDFNTSATIHDLLVARMCGLQTPVIDPSNAASWGCFDITNNKWKEEELAKLNIDESLLPNLAESGSKTGELSQSYSTRWGLPNSAPVVCAIGDNQASLLSTLSKPESDIGLTIGTGAQLSVVIDDPKAIDLSKAEIPGAEIRPYTNGKYLLVAASLCGGKAFSWLVETIEAWCHTLGLTPPDKEFVYKKLDEAGREVKDSPLDVCSSFLGERHDVNLRGSIQGIDITNFSLGNLFNGLVKNTVENLYKMLPKEAYQGRLRVLGSGNGLRRIALVQNFVEKTFKVPVIIQNTREEAAKGAAMHAYNGMKSND